MVGSLYAILSRENSSKHTSIKVFHFISSNNNYIYRLISIFRSRLKENTRSFIKCSCLKNYSRVVSKAVERWRANRWIVRLCATKIRRYRCPRYRCIIYRLEKRERQGNSGCGDSWLEIENINSPLSSLFPR